MNTSRTAAAHRSRHSMIQQRLQGLARLAFLWVAILFPLSIYGQNYNASSDFSGINNPTGVWSYGTKPTSNLSTGTFTLYPNVFDYGSDIKLWTHSTFVNVPFISKNTSASPINNGLAIWQPDQLTSHADFATASVLRFIVPVTANYNWSYEFINQSFDFSGTRIHVYNNSLLIGQATLGTYGSGGAFGDYTSPLLNAGDVWEFMVVPRADNSGNSTATGLNVLFTVAAVPEPTTYALIGLSAVAGGGVFWYRRRQQQRLAQQSVDLS